MYKIIIRLQALSIVLGVVLYSASVSLVLGFPLWLILWMARGKP